MAPNVTLHKNGKNLIFLRRNAILSNFIDKDKEALFNVAYLKQTA